MESNVLGLAIKELLNRGCTFEKEHRSGKIVHGVVMKQGQQCFGLIAKAGRFEESEEVGFASGHRFFVLNSLHQDNPLILALKPWNQTKLRFYIFDPWRIREEAGEQIQKEGPFDHLPLPMNLGWKWPLGKDLSMIWRTLKGMRRKKIRLDKFLG